MDGGMLVHGCSSRLPRGSSDMSLPTCPGPGAGHLVPDDPLPLGETFGERHMYFFTYSRAPTM